MVGGDAVGDPTGRIMAETVLFAPREDSSVSSSSESDESDKFRPDYMVNGDRLEK